MYWRCNKVFTEKAFAYILKTINYAIWDTNYSNTEESSILLTYPLFVDYLVTGIYGIIQHKYRVLAG